MDDIVRQAIAKWPRVPHCFGWLGLDARGRWYLRDAAAQALGAFGSGVPGARGAVLRHDKLIDFIGRNYEADEQGQWFFQNGPQRVYVNLEATPYIARSDPQHGFVLQTGAPLEQIEQVYWCDNGMLILRQGDVVAQVDDRDMAHVLPSLRVDGQVASDEALLAWLEKGQGNLMLLHDGKEIAVQPLAYASVPPTFGFQRAPQAE